MEKIGDGKISHPFLGEEERIQKLLTRASYGLNAVHHIDQLSHLITWMISRTLSVPQMAAYLFDQNSGEYDLWTSKGKNVYPPRFQKKDPLIKAIEKIKEPLVVDRLNETRIFKRRPAFKKKVSLRLKALHARVLVPAFIRGRLTGYLVLDRRKNQKGYGKDTLNALTVLANQAALAIENIRYWEEQKKRYKEKSFEARVASLDAMASSFAHEIDNPISIVLGQVNLIEELFNDHGIQAPKKIQKDLTSSLEYIKNSVLRISQMVTSILEYSRLETGGSEPVNMRDVIQGFMYLMLPQLKKENIRVEHRIPKSLPPVWADKIQMEEVLINLATNAIYACQKTKRKKIVMKVRKKNETTIKMQFSDNGCGMEPKVLKDIFLASVTTKGSSEGTGLGLYRCRRIMESFQGKIWAESKGRGKGATILLELPIYRWRAKINKGQQTGYKIF